LAPPRPTATIPGPPETPQPAPAPPPPAPPQGLVTPQRVTVGWFRPRRPELFTPSALPVWLLQMPGEQPLYGFPESGGAPGFKIGSFPPRGVETTDPDAALRAWRGEDDEAPLRAAAERFFPEAAGPLLAGGVCMFANTPDGHFVIDTHPRHPQARPGGGGGRRSAEPSAPRPPTPAHPRRPPARPRPRRQVVLCSACSGHGFKLSPAVGLALAELARHGRCDAFAGEMAQHALDPARPGVAAALARFAAGGGGGGSGSGG
jgi:sarcosine oxidase